MDHECQCGRRFHFKPEHAGKRARCKNCGAIFTVPGSPPGAAASPSDDPESLLAPSARATRPRRPVSPPPDSPMPNAASPAPAATASSPAGAAAGALGSLIQSAEKSTRPRGFWADAFAGIGFWMNMSNLMIWISLTIVITLAELVPLGILKLIVVLPVYGFTLGFLMETIVHTASGSDDLPAIDEWDGVWESAMKPLGRFLGTFGAVMLPAVAAAIALPQVLAADAAQTITLALWGVGIFLWPVCILAVSLGGLVVFTRPDMLIRTVFAAPLPYLAVWTFLVLAILMQAGSFIVGSGALPLRAAEWLFSGAIGSRFVSTLLFLYLTIVTMRTIGLFYRHYHDRIPWSG